MLHRKCPACNAPLIVPPTDCPSRDVHAAASEAIVDWCEASAAMGFGKAQKRAAEVAAKAAHEHADQVRGRWRAKTAATIADAIRAMRP